MPTSPANIKVLIAEDNKDLCDHYATAFMKAGFKVYTALDAEAALEKYKNKDPDIVVLDSSLNDVTGYEVLEEIRKDFNNYTPVVVVTAFDADHQKDKLDSFDAFLIKTENTPDEVVQKTTEILKINGKL